MEMPINPVYPYNSQNAVSIRSPPAAESVRAGAASLALLELVLLRAGTRKK